MKVPFDQQEHDRQLQARTKTQVKNILKYAGSMRTDCSYLLELLSQIGEHAKASKPKAKLGFDIARNDHACKASNEIIEDLQAKERDAQSMVQQISDRAGYIKSCITNTRYLICQLGKAEEIVVHLQEAQPIVSSCIHVLGEIKSTLEQVGEETRKRFSPPRLMRDSLKTASKYISDTLGFLRRTQ
jgi:hypothetical protein